MLRLLILFFLMQTFFLPLRAEDKVKDFYLSNYKQDGGIDWELKGDEAIIKDQNVNISKMAAKYYSPQDLVTVTSDKAKLNKQSMHLVLKKNVKVANKDGATLTTDVLHWQRNKNLIDTREDVRITRDTMQVDAQGMQADTALKKVDFKKDVQAQFTSPDFKGPITITCDGPLEIEYNIGQAVFYNNVVVEYEQGSLYADKATAYFDMQQKTVNRVVCEGHVKIVKEDNTTYAKKATYLRSEGRIVLEGRPKLVYHPKKAQESVF